MQKNFLKNFEKSVDKSFKMCYYSIVPARKQVYERKFVQNNLYLNSTMVRNNVNTKFLSIPSFLNNENKPSNLSKVIYRDYYLSKDIYNTIFVEFDPGSGQTLAACLTHASRTEYP